MQKHVLSRSCRYRQELSDEYLLAKCGFDAAENEPLEFWNLDENLGIWTGENSYSNSQITVGIGNLNCGVREAICSGTRVTAMLKVRLRSTRVYD